MEKRPQQEEDKELWSTLHATVLQWLYATISHDLLHTILKSDTTMMKAWNHLRDIFQDNKHSCAVTLEYDFTHVDMTDFPNVSAYCKYLKSLADQLKNIDSLISNDRLVLQLVSGLTEPYHGVATLIRQCDPLLQFYQARSMLTLEETDRAKKVAQSFSVVLVAHSSEGPPDVPDNFSFNRNTNGGKRNHNQSNNGKKYRDNNSGRGDGKGAARIDGNACCNGQLGGKNSRDTGQQSVRKNPPLYSPWAGGQQWSWMALWSPRAIPPCPYPSTSWFRPNYGQ
ncbi:uncharacterized protein LOC129873040 [Solanum dulcamara]|uniref:uncharacterized protein LOC129873040 n=1 Tax=Solanum dulcamara TaxID=45834 RepID=UPI0024850F7B|nr:uncharacterized protein LOC129873040 [Solanum dulcamara]